MQRERALLWQCRWFHLAIGGELAEQVAPGRRVEVRQPAFEVAAQGRAQSLLDLGTEVDDLVDPAAPGIGCWRVLQQEQTLDDAYRPAPKRVPLFLAQIPDLLGEVGKVERRVWPGGNEPAQGTRLVLGPGVEIALVEIFQRRRRRTARLT